MTTSSENSSEQASAEPRDTLAEPTLERRDSPLVAVARLAQSDVGVKPKGSATNVNMKTNDLGVLHALAGRANDKGQCWPSAQTIAKDARITERTVFESLKRLEGLGLITRTARRGAEGRQGSSLYTLNVKTITALAASFPRLREVHPGEVDTDAQAPPSLHPMQPDGVHEPQSGVAPDCEPRHSRLQNPTLQTAPRADKQSQEHSQEQIHPDARGRDIGTRRFEEPIHIAAFERGVRRALGDTNTYACPKTKDELKALDDAIDKHFPALKGSERLDDAIAQSAFAYRKAISGEDLRLNKQGGPRGWLDFLNDPNRATRSRDRLAKGPAKQNHGQAQELEVNF